MGEFIKMLAIYTAFMGILVILLRFKNRLIHRKRCRQYPDYDRQLTDSETHWIERLNQRLIEKVCNNDCLYAGATSFSHS